MEDSSSSYMTSRPSPRALSDRIDWNLLRTFRVIAQELSISRAAAKLHLSQPAVSQALKRLEEQVDTPLVERHGPRFTLTQAGIETLRIAGDVQGSLGQLEAALEDASGQVVGQVRLLSINGVHCPAYDRFLSKLHREYPGISLEIAVQSSETIISELANKTATFALAVNHTSYPWLRDKCLTTENYRFYCSDQHPLFGRTDLTLNDLRHEALILFSGDLLGGTLAPLAEFREKHALAGKVIASSADTQEILRLALAGFGVACLPDHLCHREVREGRLWQLPPEEGVGTLEIKIIWNAEQRLSRAESVFLALLKEMT